MIEDLEEWQKQRGKPVLVADIGNWCATAMNPQRASVLKGQRERGENYVSTLGILMRREWCVGVHWCGYVESRGEGKGWGTVDPFDEPYAEMMDAVVGFNRSMQERYQIPL